MQTTAICAFVFSMMLGVHNANAQKDSTRIQVGLYDRILWAGADAQGHLFLYMDGPRVLFRLNQKWKLGPTFFPTLAYNYRSGSFFTMLGAGLRIDYKRYALGLPMYKIEGVWRPALGFGFKF